MREPVLTGPHKEGRRQRAGDHARVCWRGMLVLLLLPMGEPLSAQTTSIPVTIHCSPPDAAIYEGAELVGRSGVAIPCAPFISRRFAIRAPHHHEVILRVDGLDPSREPPVYDVELPLLPSHVRVEVESPDRLRGTPRAEILVDGMPVATARLPYVVANLTQDVARIALVVPGFAAVEPRDIHLEPGQECTVRFPLQFQDGYFDFQLEPSNAVVSVGDQRIATGPIPVVPRRLYAIRIEAPGYRPLSFFDAAEPGQTRVVKRALQPRTYIRFEVTPTNAVIFMAGHRITDRIVEVQPHRAYSIAIRAPHCQSQQLRACTEVGETKVLRVELKPRLFDF